MQTTRSIMLAIALFLAFTTTALAMHHGKGPGLSPDKLAVVEKAHDDFAVATADLKRQIFGKESSLDAELYGDETDEKKVDDLVTEINALHGKIYSERVKMQRIIAKEGILPQMGSGMMGGGGCPMMGGMRGGHGEKNGHKHGKTNATPPEVTSDANAPGGHDAHAPAKQ